MRFSDHIAKCHATVKIMADGHECPQYKITGDEHGNMQCYIPLMSEQVVTAEVQLDMVSEHFEVDLFVDGVIRNFWQSTRNSVNKHRAPIVGFTQGIYKDTRSMYRSDMITAAIPPRKRMLTSGSQRTNVGSIDIMISKQDPERNAHFHGCMLPDEVPKDWNNQVLAPNTGSLEPTLQMIFKDGTRMQEADRGGTRIRLKRTREGEAPWCTFKFLYREPGTWMCTRISFLDLANAFSAAQLRAEGIGSAIRCGYGGRLLGPLADASRKRAASDDRADGSISPSTDLEVSRHHLEDLRSEVLELKMQAERAKRVRLEKEKMTDEIARETRQQWAELELAKKDLVRQLEDEKAKAAAQEAEQQNLRQGYANAIHARQMSE
ncbi:MAG: hypothetical protein L6R38_004444 [Xanthoria sp. 2 TBL-2021]|nr:MAG: hypothetical protein L6R38_004444 [Xanthoria sp. 2 TBL-2021]